MFAEWLCGTCYPRIVKGTYGRVILHGLNFHKLRFKEARTNLTLESEAKTWQEKPTNLKERLSKMSSPETIPKEDNLQTRLQEDNLQTRLQEGSPEMKPATGEKAGTEPGKKPADP